jgi:hypothetical protein
MNKFQVEIGQKVAYSVQFLRSIGESHGEMAHARGVVKEIAYITPTLVLAKIDWQGADMPDKVNVCNLAKVGPNTRFCQC